MEKKKNIIQYHLIKILKKTDSTVTYVANKNFMSFKNLIRQIDLSKISEQEKLLLENEIKINSLFNTRFILKIEDSKFDNKKLNIISEYFKSETLQKFLESEKKKDRKFLKEEIIWKIFIQLCFAIYHIHNKNIIHRNIKSSNILLDNEYNLKLTNFKKAFALKSENDFCYDFNLIENNNKENIIPPEILLKEGYNTKYDIWNLGVILYEMCSFNKPFIGDKEEEINKKIIENSYPSIGNKYSKELTMLISQLLLKRQSERPSIKDIIHKYVFISRSKETNLYDFLDKIINPHKAKEKRVFSSQGNKNLKRPSSAIQVKREVKKSANIKRTRDYEKEKEENDIDILTKKFLKVKNNVKDLIGKENAENLFEELTDINVEEMINKYYKNDEKNKEDIDKINEKSNELKKYVEEYINIMNKVCLIKNKI